MTAVRSFDRALGRSHFSGGGGSHVWSAICDRRFDTRGGRSTGSEGGGERSGGRGGGHGGGRGWNARWSGRGLSRGGGRFRNGGRRFLDRGGAWRRSHRWRRRYGLGRRRRFGGADDRWSLRALRNLRCAGHQPGGRGSGRRTRDRGGGLGSGHGRRGWLFRLGRIEIIEVLHEVPEEVVAGRSRLSARLRRGRPEVPGKSAGQALDPVRRERAPADGTLQLLARGPPPRSVGPKACRRGRSGPLDGTGLYVQHHHSDVYTENWARVGARRGARWRRAEGVGR